jgi:hypothetical protein
VRATLHDELMREAGFESDYYVELAQRREWRRERLRRDILRTTTLVAFVGAIAGGVVVIVGMAGKTAHVPSALWGAIVLMAGLGTFAQWLQNRMAGDESDPRRPGLWERITRPWRNDA